MRRTIGDTLSRLRLAVAARSPGWARRWLGPAAMYFDALVFDHGVLRLVWDNRHRLSNVAWRSAQPDPRRIRGWARRGIRTVLNLRGRQSSGSYWLEQRACAEAGLRLVDFPLRSYEAPSPDQLRLARALLEEMEYPVLMHCKSGADRSGLMAVLYRVVREGAPIREARTELALRFGHLRMLDTGILDHLLDTYLRDDARCPTGFFEWVDQVYDRDAVTESFRARSFRQRLGGGPAADSTG